MDPLQWSSMNHDDEPRDQQADLFAGYWAQVGPDGREGHEAWSWCVLDFDEDNEVAAQGGAPTEEAAKAAVQVWADDEEPEDTGCATCQSARGCRCDDIYEAYRDEQLGL